MNRKHDSVLRWTLFFGLTAGIAALIVVASAASGGGRSGRREPIESSPVPLQLKFKPGDAFKYQTTMQIGFALPPVGGPRPPAGKAAASPASVLAGTTFSVNAVQDVTVRKAEPSGGGEVDVITTGQNTLPGQPPILSNDTRPVMMTYDAQGKLTKIQRQSETASGSPLFGAMLGQGLLCMQGVVLPAKPVRVGDTWTQRVQIPGITGSGSSTIKTTFARIENAGKYKTARLHVTISTPVSAYLDAALQPTTRAAGAASSMTGTALVTDEIDFAIAEGRVVRSVSKGVTTMSVALGRPTIAAPPKPKKGKKGANAPHSAPAAQTGQMLTMAVHTDIETNLVDPAKK